MSTAALISISLPGMDDAREDDQVQKHLTKFLQSLVDEHGADNAHALLYAGPETIEINAKVPKERLEALSARLANSKQAKEN